MSFVWVLCACLNGAPADLRRDKGALVAPVAGEEEQAEAPVAGMHDPVAVLVFGQGHAQEIVAVGVDVAADLGGVGRVGDVHEPEPAGGGLRVEVSISVSGNAQR